MQQPERALQSLTLDQRYSCPICRHGQLQGMVLMDAFSCDFCRHIFSVNLQEQVLRVEDRVPKSAWQLKKGRWRSLNPVSVDLSAIIWLTGAFLVLVPAGLIGLSAYVFPPIGGLTWSSFPVMWGEFTLMAHGIIAIWLLLEHYQLPSYVAAQIAWARAWERLRSN